jgi:hypothetical protein
MHYPQHESPSTFALKPGEKIIGYFPLWTGGSDRIVEEIANCNHCLRPTHRVIVVTTAAGLEKRASLCMTHFVAAAREIPELK